MPRKITNDSWEEYSIVDLWPLCTAGINSADKSVQDLAWFQEEVLHPVYTYVVKFTLN